MDKWYTIFGVGCEATIYGFCHTWSLGFKRICQGQRPQTDGLDESGFVFLQIQRKMGSLKQRDAQNRPQREGTWLSLSISQKLVCVARHCEQRELLRGVVSAAITVCDIARIPGSHDFRVCRPFRFSRQPDDGVSRSGNEALNEMHIFLTHSIPVRRCNHLLAFATQILQIQSCRTFWPCDVSGRRGFGMPRMVKLEEIPLIV